MNIALLKPNLPMLSGLLIGSILSVSNVLADSPSTPLNYAPHFGEDGWDLSLGFGVHIDTGSFYLGEDEHTQGFDLFGGFTYVNGNFYVTGTEYDGLLFGYKLKNVGNAVLDVNFGPKFEIDFDTTTALDDQLKHLDNRDPDGHLGLRYSLYGENKRISLSFSKDIVGAHNGSLLQMEYLHEWQVQNWLISGIAELTFISSDMVNHAIGVSGEEAARGTIEEFKAEAGQMISLQLTAEYPLAEDWIFHTKITNFSFSSEIDASPITDIKTDIEFAMGLIYQF